MNIEMDARAKQLVQLPYQGPVQYTIPYEGWQCAIQGKWILKQLPKKLSDYINGITIQHHWAKKANMVKVLCTW